MMGMKSQQQQSANYGDEVEIYPPEWAPKVVESKRPSKAGGPGGHVITYVRPATRDDGTPASSEWAMSKVKLDSPRLQAALANAGLELEALLGQPERGPCATEIIVALLGGWGEVAGVVRVPRSCHMRPLDADVGRLHATVTDFLFDTFSCIAGLAPESRLT